MPHDTIPTIASVFVGFLHIALTSFGGALPWAYRYLVERRRWVTSDDFTNILSLCRFFPGAPVLNLAIVVGARWHGAMGAITAALGFVAVPALISVALGVLHMAVGEIGWLRGGLAGVAAAAGGMAVSMAIKITVDLARRQPFVGPLFTALTFAGVVVAALPITWVVAGLAPISVAVAWRQR